MKPPIEYRPKPKGGEANRDLPKRSTNIAQPQAKAVEPTSGADYIVIRRDRAKYNAYMRAYRAKKRGANT